MRRERAAVIVIMLLLTMSSPRPSAQGQQSAPAEQSLPRFVVTLALGDMQKGEFGKFSQAENKALNDLLGFLPYLRYQPLDTVYLIGLNGPHQYLKGPEGREHEFHMRGGVVSADMTQVQLLRLWSPAPLEKGGRGPTALIDTSFKIQKGETVVVGTSRLDGARALILLVTSVK